MEARIVLLPGDGIGPEVVAAARRVLETVAQARGHRWSFATHPIGGAAMEETGHPLPPSTLRACHGADAVLLGAVGGPQWDDPTAAVRPEQGLLGLRRELGLFANLRPVRPHPALAASSPLRADRIAGVDVLVVRELTGGLYFGRPRGRVDTERGVKAIDTLEYTEDEIQRVVRLAFDLASRRRGKLTSVDKANVLESSRLWRETATKVARDYPSVELDHQLVDAAAMRLLTRAPDFDVIVTENMFGDILTDEASVIAGSLGLLPSASLGSGRRGLYEPIHGSAPDIAGRGVANPLGTIASAALMMRWSLGCEADAERVEQAIDAALSNGARTRDLGGDLTTEQMTDRVLDFLDR
jgi:3-isopropylmalate dehydrogenase